MFDFCIVSFSSLKNDARSLNLMRTLSEKFNICAVSITPANDFQALTDCNFEHFGIELSKNAHFWQWIEFRRKAVAIPSIQKSKVYIACDLYSLAPIVSLKKNQNSKVLYDSREIYSALGPLANAKLKQIAIAKIEKYFVRYVDEFIVSGDLDAKYLQSYFFTDKAFHTIMNVPFFSEPIESDIIKTKYPYLKDKTLLLYQGAVLQGRGLMPTLDVLAKDDSLGLAILGDGGYLNQVKSRAAELGLLDRVAFCGKIPYIELHNYACSCDIGMNIIEPISFSYKMALPNKMFEYAIAGLPQITSDLPAMSKIIDEYGIGELVDAKIDTDEIIDKIGIIKQNYDEYRENCINAAKIFNYENQQDEINTIAHRLIYDAKQ